MRGGPLLVACVVLLSGCVVTEADLEEGRQAAADAVPTSDLDAAPRVVLQETLDRDTCLTYTGDVHLLGGAIARASASGASLAILVRGGSLLLDAGLAAGAGEPGPHVAATHDVVALDGDDGGSVVLLAPDGVVELRVGAARTGNGGHGGSARTDDGNATAGDGGAGGWFVAGGREVRAGRYVVELGAGAPGGDASSSRADGAGTLTQGLPGADGVLHDVDAAQAAALADALAADCSDVRGTLERVLAPAAVGSA